MHPPPGDPHSPEGKEELLQESQWFYANLPAKPVSVPPPSPASSGASAPASQRWVRTGRVTPIDPLRDLEVNSACSGQRNTSTGLRLGPRSTIGGTDSSGKRNFMKGKLAFSMSHIRRRKQVQLRTNLVQMVNEEF